MRPSQRSPAQTSPWAESNVWPVVRLDFCCSRALQCEHLCTKSMPWYNRSFDTGQLISNDLKQLIAVTKNHKTYWNRVTQVQMSTASQPGKSWWMDYRQAEKTFHSHHATLINFLPSCHFILVRVSSMAVGDARLCVPGRAAAAAFVPQLEAAGKGLVF